MPVSRSWYYRRLRARAPSSRSGLYTSESPPLSPVEVSTQPLLAGPAELAESASEQASERDQYEAELKLTEGLIETDGSDAFVDGEDGGNSATPYASLNVKIFTVHGLDGGHTWTRNCPLTGPLDPVTFTFRPDLLLGEDTTDEAVKDAGKSLLKLVIDVILTPESGEPSAIIFLARDIGGAVVKQALVESSRNPDYKAVVENTTHLFFFGTPHRASVHAPWQSTILNLLSYQTRDVPGPKLTKRVQSLVKTHEDLAAAFDSLAQRYRFRAISCFQEPHRSDSSSLSYDVVIPEFAAALGWDDEARVGLRRSHRLLADLSIPETQKLFLSAIRSANLAVSGDFQKAMALLAQYDRGTPSPRNTSQWYSKLSSYLLSTENLSQFVARDSPVNDGSTHLEGSVLKQFSGVAMDAAETLSVRKPEYIAKSLHVLEVVRWAGEIADLASSLTASIYERRYRPLDQDHFITLRQHPSRTTPTSRTQLMLAIVRQYLWHHPLSFSRTRSMFDAVEAAFRTGNETWQETSVWILLRALLGCQGSGQTFLVIAQPDGSFGRPFEELIATLLFFVRESEVPCKILLIGGGSSNPLAVPTSMLTRVDLSDETSGAYSAFHNDRKAAIGRILDETPRLPHLLDSLDNFIDCPLARVLSPEQCLAILDCHVLPPLSWPAAQPVSQAKGDEYPLDLILNSVPHFARPQVRIGLVWLSHALQPLSHAEFASVITGIDTTIDEKHAAALVHWFKRVLCGVLAVDKEFVFPASSVWSTLLRARLGPQEGECQPESQAEAEGDARKYATRMDASEWYRSNAHPHLDIAQSCIELLRQHFNDGGSEQDARAHEETIPSDNEHTQEAAAVAGQGRDAASTGGGSTEGVEPMGGKAITGPPLLAYAAKHWLSHIQLWISDSDNKADMLGEARDLSTILQFAKENRLVNLWLDMRNSLLGQITRTKTQYDITGVMRTLGLDIDSQRDVLRVLGLILCASDRRLEWEGDMPSSLFIAACRLNDLDALTKLRDAKIKDDGLEAAFAVAAGGTLDLLVDMHPDFVDHNRARVASQAVRLGDAKLLGKLRRLENERTSTDSDPLVALDLLPFQASAELGRASSPDIFCQALRANSSGYLHPAASSGQTLLLHQLLKQEPDVNMADGTGATPLLLAARNGRFAVVRQLLAAGANPSIADRTGQTPLHAASSGGHTRTVGLLPEPRMWLGTKDRRGNTPLHLALSNDHVETALTLLQHVPRCYQGPAGVAWTRISTIPKDPKPNEVGRTVQLLASAKSPTAAVQAKFPGLFPADGEFPTGASGSPSLRVMHISPIVIVIDSESRTIFVASAQPEKKAPRSFGLDSRNKNRMTPLLLAAQRGHSAVVAALIQLQARCAVFDKELKTPLHLGAALDSPDIVSQLLSVADVNVDRQDASKSTALHVACARGNVEVIERLAAARASCDIRDSGGLSPLELACERRSTGAVKTLARLSTRESLTAAFLKAVSCGHTEAAEILLDAGADKNASSPDSGWTALHHGAKQSDVRLLRTLLVRQAYLNLNQKDVAGKTPLILAAENHAPACLKLLIDAGAQINAIGDGGITALYTAAVAGCPRCVAVLLSAGAVLKVPTHPHGNGPDSFIDVALLKFKSGVFRQILEFVTRQAESWQQQLSDGTLHAFLRAADTDGEVLAKMEIMLSQGLDHKRVIGGYGTMLHYAVLWDKPWLVLLLASEGRARPGIPHKGHGTPLLIAIEHYGKAHALEIIRTLLEQGADACLTGSESRAPLHAAVGIWASGSSHLAVARTIIEHSPGALNLVLEKTLYPTVLQSVVARGSLDMLELILEREPDLGVQAGKYGTPLHLAAAQSLDQEMQLLLDAGVGVLTLETRDVEGRLPLHLAPLSTWRLPSGYRDLCETSGWARPRTPDFHGRQLAHFAAAAGDGPMLRELVSEEGPAVLREQDHDGWTPLHWACRAPSASAARAILEALKPGDAAVRGPETAKTVRGWRPIDVAVYHGRGIFSDDADLETLLRPDDDGDNDCGGGGAANPRASGTTLLPPCDEENTQLTQPRTNEVSVCSCDSCRCKIYGPRYQCLNCYDLDVCFKCFRHVKVHHYKGHKFVEWNMAGEKLNRYTEVKRPEDGAKTEPKEVGDVQAEKAESKVEVLAALE